MYYKVTKEMLQALAKAAYAHGLYADAETKDKVADAFDVCLSDHIPMEFDIHEYGESLGLVVVPSVYAINVVFIDGTLYYNPNIPKEDLKRYIEELEKKHETT